MGTSATFAQKELGAFLRSRRERRSPAEAGLGATGRRRTPGLRRGEVARLAGVSVTWYTWLEQGRNISVSSQVLTSIARALGLTPAEREHLFSLAGDRLPPPVGEQRPAEDDARQLLALLDPCPAWVFDQYFDILAWNRAAQGLLVGIADLPPDQLNALHMTFLNHRSRQLLPEWESEARRLVSLLRAEAAKRGTDPRYETLVAEYRERSPEFRDLWDSRDVSSFTPATRRFRHPVLGPLQLRYLKLDLVGERRRSAIVHFLPDDDPDYPLLRRLVEIGSDGAPPRWAPRNQAATSSPHVVNADILRGRSLCKKSDPD